MPGRNIQRRRIQQRYNDQVGSDDDAKFGKPGIEKVPC
jgi:hypothetical protein